MTAPSGPGGTPEGAARSGREDVDPPEVGATGPGVTDDDADLLHDARIELDQWRRSLRMDPLDGPPSGHPQT